MISGSYGDRCFFNGWGPGAGAPHSSEVAYVFHILKERVAFAGSPQIPPSRSQR